MMDFYSSRKKLLSAIAVVWVFGIGGLFFWEWMSPPPPTVNVYHWTTGHLLREGLMFEMADEFNSQKNTTADGKVIRVTVYNAPSELIGRYLTQRIKFGTRMDLHKETNGYVAKDIKEPTIVTPSSAHWLVSTNFDVGRDVVDLQGAEPIVRPVIGIVTYEEMARCLGWPGKELGFQDIIDLRAGDVGWAAHPECARSEWGNKPLLAFTDPTTSSTGRSLHLALYAMASGKAPEQLVLDDVNDPEVVRYVRDFQNLIDHYQIGTTVLNTKIAQGPRWGHFFVMPEDNLIHLIEGTESAYINGKKVQLDGGMEHNMVMIYPKEGSMPRNNCACIVSADWVSPEQVEASHEWIDFIREDAQQRKFMAAGFRPGTDISLEDPASKIRPEFGLMADGPRKILNPSLTPPAVAAEIDRTWEQVKRPGIVNFVIDTSSSMMGNKLDQAKSGVERAIDNMANSNRLGMISFSNEVNTEVPIKPKLEMAHGTTIADTAREFSAAGSTALFDALHRAIISVDNAEGDEGAIRAVVLLTDGQANEGTYGLNDIVRMSSRSERPVPDYRGFEDEAAYDDQRRHVPLEEVIGQGLAIETKHDIQIFFIGVGEDADLNVGRILTEATGASMRGVPEEDLAQVMEEFSRYF